MYKYVYILIRFLFRQSLDISLNYVGDERGECGKGPLLTLDLAFTRYSFTSKLSCTNHPSFHSPRPPALPTLMQYYCTHIGRYMTPLPTSRSYAIHHT